MPLQKTLCKSTAGPRIVTGKGREQRREDGRDDGEGDADGEGAARSDEVRVLLVCTGEKQPTPSPGCDGLIDFWKSSEGWEQREKEAQIFSMLLFRTLQEAGGTLHPHATHLAKKIGLYCRRQSHRDLSIQQPFDEKLC